MKAIKIILALLLTVLILFTARYFGPNRRYTVAADLDGIALSHKVPRSQEGQGPAELSLKVNFYGQDAGIELAGRKIFIVHYPHYAHAMSTTGEWDLVCCGHDHKVTINTIQNMKQSTTTLINPGTVGGVGATPTYILGDLSTMDFEIHHVPVDESMAYNKPHVTVHD